MDSTGSQCPEDSNSTDCLFRTLLQFLNEQQQGDDAEIDWDPINFAFTLLIGVLALIFAIAAVAQAVLSTGKGRRITSNRAIGKWSTETRKQWSWREMNFQYTASTPVLRENLFMVILIESPKESEGGDNVDEKTDKHEIAEDSTVANTEMFQGNAASAKRSHKASRPRLRDPFKVWSEVPSPSSPARHQPSAPWLEFFKELGLDNLEVSHWKESIREVSADHLPDDLVAAPAYGQVGAIIAAAATTGIDKLYIDQQKYPIVLGHGFQIDFRQHPALGLICAYSRYGKASRRAKLRSLGFQELNSAMEHGRGIVSCGRHASMSVYAKSTRRRLLGQFYWTQETWLEDTKGKARMAENFFFIDVAAISEVHLPLIIGLRAYTPKYVPALFPIASMRISFPLTLLALNGNYWAQENLQKFSDSDIFQWPTTRFTEIWDGFVWRDPDNTPMHQYIDYIDCLYRESDFSVEEYVAAIDDAWTQREQMATTGYRVVLHMCLKLLHRPEEVEAWFFGLSPLEQRFLRIMILAQMKDVDLWLQHRKVDREKRSIFLCSRTIFFLQAEKIIHDGSYGGFHCEENPDNNGEHNSMETARKIHDNTLQVLRNAVDEPGENQPLIRELEHLVDRHPTHYTTTNIRNKIKFLLVQNLENYSERGQPVQSDKQANNIDDVIIYRCLMMILLFQTAPDSSKILESGLWDMVVPFI